MRAKRETECEQGWGGRSSRRGRQRLWSRLPAEHGGCRGALSHNQKITTGVETKSARPTNCATRHPWEGAFSTSFHLNPLRHGMTLFLFSGQKSLDPESLTRRPSEEELSAHTTMAAWGESARSLLSGACESKNYTPSEITQIYYEELSTLPHPMRRRTARCEAELATLSEASASPMCREVERMQMDCTVCPHTSQCGFIVGGERGRTEST